MSQPIETQLLALTQELLEAIARGDWPTYVRLCDPGMTAIEPEAPAQIVRGLDFHKFYFDLPRSPGARQTTLTQPVVHLAGDMAVVAYVRLVQKLEDGRPKTVASAETRVWRRQGDTWRHVHFQRSPLQGA
jgi:ketosteroid isomerase-like protein